MLRARLKGLAELIALHAGGRILGGLRRRGRVLILSYHNVVPRGEAPRGDRSLHLSQPAFGRQLDQLLHDHDVVPLVELWREPPARGRSRAAITFDDGYAGTLTAGLEELAQRGLPATVFVPPAFIGGRSFWWDDLAERFAGVLPPDLRARLLTELAGDDEPIRRWASEQGLSAGEVLPAWARAATEKELRSAAAYRGLTLGSHTWSHLNLTVIDPTRRLLELTRSKAWLESAFPQVSIPWLSYPYGLETVDTRADAQAAGYVASVRGAGGHFQPGAAPLHALPRLNVPAGLSGPGFALRTAGLSAR
jgi:peptidoglycan/xylan/chitin deacetylase (PgdA/CDA1 family)